MLLDELSPWMDVSAGALQDPHILDAVLDGFEAPACVVDQGLRVVRFNRSCADDILARRGQVLRPGMRLFEIVPEGEHRDQVLARVHEALTGIAGSHTGWVDVSGQSRIHRETRFLPIRNEGGAIVGVAVLTRPAPLCERGGEEARSASDRAEQWFVEAPHGICMVRLDGTIEQANPAFVRFLGTTLEKLVGRSIDDITLPQDRGISPLTALARGGLTRYAVEKRYRRDDGRTVHGKVTAVRLSGEPSRILGIVEDLDSIRAGEPADHERDTRGRAIFESQPDGVALVSRDGYVLEVNAAFARMLGRDREHTLGMHVSEFDIGRSRNELAECLAKAMESAGRFESRHCRADGTIFPVEVAVTPMSFGGQCLICCSVRDISHQRALEIERTISDDRYRDLIESSPSVTYSFSTVRGGLYYSPQVKALLGYTPTELVAHPFHWLEAIHPQDRPAVDAAMAAMEQNGSFDLELRIRHKDGSWRWIREWSASITRTERELIVVGQALDLTPLRAQEAQLARLVRCAPDIMYRWAPLPEPHFEYISPAVERILGYTAEELCHDALLIQERTHPDDFARIEVATGSELAPDAVLRARVMHKAGRVVWLELRRSVLRDNDGRPLALEGIARDITAQVALEERLKMMASALEQAAEVAIITDRSGGIVEVNAAFERITGYTRQEVLGKNPRILKSGLQGKEFYDRMWRTLQAGEIWRSTMINRRKDGSHYTAEAVVTPVLNEHGETVNYIALQRDITRERLLDEALRQSQKMEAVGQVTGGVAHDFNNMLTVILANASLIEEELAEGSEAKIWLQELTSAAQHGTAMIRQLLAFGRREHLAPRPIRLADEFAVFIPVLRRVLNEQIELSMSGSTREWALADRTSFEQMILNLATNARDAMPHGGKVTVQIGQRVITEHDAEQMAGVALTGSYSTITLEDTGAGMDAATLRRVFEPFFTTKPIGKGSGLGLSMVFGLMQQHKGWVDVRSTLGKGTSVTLGFPTTSPPAHPAEEKPLPTAGRAPARGELILVVEDEDALRRVAVRALEREGYRVISAADGEGGWAQWNEHGDAIALILTDAVMPKLGGPDLIRRLRASGSGVPVILMSGYSTEDLSDVTLAGIPVISKPWTSEALATGIRQVLARHVDG